MRIEGGKIVNAAINKGHTVTTEDLKGEMPSVLNMIPRCDISFPLFPSCISAKIVSFDSGLIIKIFTIFCSAENINISKALS